MSSLTWRRVFRLWPVRFTHGPDGYLRGCWNSQRDGELPRWSGWFCWVERAEQHTYGPYYRPLPFRRAHRPEAGP